MTFYTYAKPVFLLVLSFTFFLPALFAEIPQTLSDAKPLSFDECYQKILAHYPVLKKQNERVEQAIAEKFLSYSALFPAVKGLSSVRTSDDAVDVFGMLLRQEKFTADDFALSRLNSPRHHTNFNFSGEGELPLFNAFQTISNIKSSKLLLQSEQYRKELLETEALLLATEGYLKVLTANEMLMLVRQIQSLSGEDLKQAEDLKEKGMVLGADFFAARVTRGGIEQNENRFISEEKVALILLNILMGENPETNYKISGFIPEQIRPRRPYGDWLSEAYHGRKDLKALQTQIQASGVNFFKQKASALPRVSAFGSLAEDSHDLRSGGESFTMGVRGTLDILDPSYFPRWKRAKHALSEVKHDETILKDQIASVLAREAVQYEMLVRDFSVADKSFSDAKEAVTLTAKLYQEGRKSIADVLEMRKAYLETGIRRVWILAEAELQYVKLLYLSGSLDQDTVKEVASRINQKP